MLSESDSLTKNKNKIFDFPAQNDKVHSIVHFQCFSIYLFLVDFSVKRHYLLSIKSEGR